MSERCYFLTGASGFVGGAILREIARQDPAARAYATLRAPSGELEVRATRLGWRDVAPRALPVGADLSRLRAGLSPRDLERLTAEVTHVIHAGGSARCDEDIHRARQVNVAGTRQLLELATRMRRLERFVHVSTSFVCGDRPGTLVEGPTPPGRFRNAYERSKFEAEEMVRRAMVRLPITVVRPSSVVPALAPAPARTAPPAAPAAALPHDVAAAPRGRNELGAGLILLLHSCSTQGWRRIPGSPSALVDLIPVDVVARAIVALAHRTLGDGRWYHLAAGPDATTLREIVALASRTRHTPAPHFAPPGWLGRALHALVRRDARPELGRAAPYLPYLRVRTRVDTTDSHRVLREHGIVVPRATATFAALLAQLDAGGEAAGRARSAAVRPPTRFSAGRAHAAAAPHALGRRS